MLVAILHYSAVLDNKKQLPLDAWQSFKTITITCELFSGFVPNLGCDGLDFVFTFECDSCFLVFSKSAFTFLEIKLFMFEITLLFTCSHL